MGLFRRRKRDDDYDHAPVEEEVVDEREDRRVGYSDSMAERMRRLDTYSYEFDENEAEEVEARIRRMFYGAKVEDD